ncbi:GntR family transcriptional regulator [Streptomyces sp. NPDC002490]|uniref:GntR family transcriptional regulator n=1 Tax=Streptomyces sp. NPDC002490 TaxID=3154416 RepID=UPI00332C481C
MSEPQISPHTPRAPYMRVRDALAADIAAGVYGPGAAIPSEAELAVMYGVAKMTARRAVRELRERGLVYTEWGKGSFVVGGPAPGSRGGA